MSVPFSNTTLRIPRGFGNLLEGLSREVLRQQPEDIIVFAAMYFEDLLAKRMASGIDPADWAARLEDRFYNNHIFKEKRTTTPEDKSPPETTDAAYKEKGVGASTIDMPESREGAQKKCVKKPMHFTSISQQTISMMLEDKKIDALSPKQAPAEGAVDETASLTIEGPAEAPKEDTDSVIIETAPEEGPKEYTAPLMVEAAPEGPKEYTASVIIEAAPEEGPKEYTASVIIEAVPTGEEIEQIQTPEEPLVLEKQEDTTSSNEDQAAVIIQATYRGYNTRKKLKDGKSSSPAQADNELFTEDYPGTDGSEYSSGEELTFAEDDNVSFAEALGVSHEEPKSRMEGNGSAAKVDTALVNICATELGSPLEKENFQGFNTDVDICGTELQTDTKEDNKFEPNIDTETAGHDICGTELNQKDLFEATFSGTANVDTCGPELEGFVAEKDTGDETNEGTKIDTELQGEPGDEVTGEAVHHYEAGVSGTVEDSEDQADESQKNTEDIKEESKLMTYTKDNDNLPTEENLDAEGDSSMADKEEACVKHEEEDVLDIPLDDEEANAAAAKIQASFRGHMTRKKLKGGEKEEPEQKADDTREGEEEAPAEAAEVTSTTAGDSGEADAAEEGEDQSGVNEEAKEGTSVNGDQSETAPEDGGKAPEEVKGEAEAAAPEQ